MDLLPTLLLIQHPCGSRSDKLGSIIFCELITYSKLKLETVGKL